jgi:hypothetical protein
MHLKDINFHSVYCILKESKKCKTSIIIANLQTILVLPNLALPNLALPNLALPNLALPYNNVIAR